MLNSIKKTKLNIENLVNLFPNNSKQSTSSMIRLDKQPETVELSSEENNFYKKDDDGNVSLEHVSPELAVKMKQLVELSAKAGINIRITQQTRSIDEQNALYAKGRNKKGEIKHPELVVTNAKGDDYKSNHQWGTAFDICINEKGNEYDKEKLKKVGEIGKSIGLEWGGDWKTITDNPHFELKDAEEIKKTYKNPGEYADRWYTVKK